MIDRFGQYMHKTWPGKTTSESDMRQAAKEEARDLEQHRGPREWDTYGGWASGPKLRATGRFRVEKVEGKWWLVDPDGYLFWSHGVDCVHARSGITAITDREFYFEGLPEQNTTQSSFYGQGNWAPHGYYKGRGTYQTFNFTASNLQRKYGPDWQSSFSELCHRRLRSWGMNTIANWSDPEIYGMKKTPYVLSSSSARRPIEGSSGWWGPFPDPFDAGFERETRSNLARLKKDGNTPWCIGVFVDNELSWGNDDTSLAVATLRSPAAQPAKKVFIQTLRDKYQNIEALNHAWGTTYPSWDALLTSVEPPDQTQSHEDLAAFHFRIAKEYFRVCRQAVKASMPETLYLGCRFAWGSDLALRAAGLYCDVIGLNKYQYTVAAYSLPEGVDKPAIIGEFHFGALDRGMLHTGLNPVPSQAERAAAYRDYVRGALENPYWVGTHWFQYGEQATTGRGDGENYQIGLLDICDQPYPEIIAAVRSVGEEMYPCRFGK